MMRQAAMSTENQIEYMESTKEKIGEEKIEKSYTDNVLIVIKWKSEALDGSKDIVELINKWIK